MCPGLSESMDRILEQCGLREETEPEEDISMNRYKEWVISRHDNPAPITKL